MKYIIEYKYCENKVDSTYKLVLYDFGYVKGFLYNNEFTMYKIISKNNINECVEVYDNTIPKVAFSIEIYDCIYENNIYITPQYTISITPLLVQEPLLELLPPLAQIQAPPPLRQTSYNTKIHLNKRPQVQGVVHGKVQQVIPEKQETLNYPSAVKHRWTSLEQLMKVPSPSVGQEFHIQQKQQRKHLIPLMPKNSSSLPLRPHQVKGETPFQNSSRLD